MYPLATFNISSTFHFPILEATNLLFVLMSLVWCLFVCLFVCLESTCEWDHKVFVFNLFHKSKMPQGSPCCCIWQDFLFYGWIIFHCVIHNLYQSIIIVLWFTHGWLNDLLKSGLLMKIIFIIWNIIYYETYKNVKN